MDPTVQVEIVKQGGALLNALLFLVAGLFLVLHFRKGFGDFFRRLSEFSLKTPAGEFSAKAAAEAGALLSAAQVARRDDGDADADAETLGEGGPPPRAPVQDVRAVTESVRVAAQAAPRLRDRTLLWVDDNPQNNELIARAFQALGVRVEIAHSTEEGLRRIRAGGIDLAITDLTRGGDGEAGLTFIQEVRALDRRLKTIVYSSRRGARKYPRAYELGAVAATYDPNDLFDSVVAHLGG